MKQFYVFVISFLVSVPMYTQSLDQSLLGVSNGRFNDADLHLEWSIGEPFVEYKITDFGILTEGLLQPEVFNSSFSPEQKPTTNLLFHQGLLQAYPNPVNDVLTLKLKAPQITASHIRILDFTGKVMSHSILPAGVQQQELSFRNLPSGPYLIQLMPVEGQTSKMIKVIKERE